jgi:hypothetical protein
MLAHVYLALDSSPDSLTVISLLFASIDLQNNIVGDWAVLGISATWILQNMH